MYQYVVGLDESPATLSTALEEARKGAGLAPESPLAAAVLAQALAVSDRLTPALEAARRAVTLDPESAEAQLSLCTVLRLQRDDAGAFEACRKAAAISPRDPRVLASLGEILRETGQYDEAMEMFGQAIDLDHEAIIPQLGTAATLAKRGSANLARGLYNLLLMKWDYGRSRARLGAAALLVLEQEYAAALELYESLDVPEGTSMPAVLILYGKGYCLSRLGREAEAEYFWSSLVERLPTDYDGPVRGRELLFKAYDDLLAFFTSRGRDRKAMTILQSACDRPHVPTRLARALADRLEAGKQADKAATVLENAILGADAHEDPLELAESALKLARLRTTNGTRRLAGDSPTARALSSVASRLKAADPGAAHYRLARALALAQRHDEVVPRLVQARDSGFLPVDLLPSEPDFENVRQDPAFKALITPPSPAQP